MQSNPNRLKLSLVGWARSHGINRFCCPYCPGEFRFRNRGFNNSKRKTLRSFRKGCLKRLSF